MRVLTTCTHNFSALLCRFNVLISAVGIMMLISTSALNAAPLVPPAVPANGAYVGAWVNPGGLHDAPGTEAGNVEIQQLPAFNQSLGGPTVAILSVYVGFTKLLPVDTLNAIEQNGSIPMISWGCGSLSDIASGTDDAIITSFAQSMKSFQKPIFLRWYWEMNDVNSNCYTSGDQQAYIQAWAHIWNIFHRISATNVAFVWCPSHAPSGTPYYPGDQYVDWVCADGYNFNEEVGKGKSDFEGIFDDFYNTWNGTKPIMIGETAAIQGYQPTYIWAMTKFLPTNYPGIKGVVWFDAPGKNGDQWELGSEATTAFATMLETPYFLSGSGNVPRSAAADEGPR